MSLIVCVNNSQCIVLAAESRMTIKEYSPQKKLLKKSYMDIPGCKCILDDKKKFGIVYCGREDLKVGFAKECINTILRNISLENKSVCSLAVELASYLELLDAKETILFLAGFDGNKPMIYRIKGLIETEWLNKNESHGFWAEGVTNICQSIPDFENMPTELLVKFASGFIKEMIKEADNENMDINAREVLKGCGGEIDIIVIEKTGCYMMKF